jgi:hypothetical protein
MRSWGPGFEPVGIVSPCWAKKLLLLSGENLDRVCRDFRKKMRTKGRKEMNRRAWVAVGLILLLACGVLPVAAAEPGAVPKDGLKAEEPVREVGRHPGTEIREEARKAGQEMETAGQEVEKEVQQGAETVEHGVKDGAQDFGTGISD